MLVRTMNVTRFIVTEADTALQNTLFPNITYRTRRTPTLKMNIRAFWKVRERDNLPPRESLSGARR
jgi:hypothetical protein